MSMSVTIGGPDRTVMLARSSLRVSAPINGAASASFTLKDPLGTYWPDVGAPVDIYDENGTLIFGGSVDEPDSSQQLGTAKPMWTATRCSDWHYLLDRRIVVQTYQGKTVDWIVGDLITRYLAADGISAGSISAGPTIDDVRFNYKTFASALNYLSTQSGLQWVCRPDKTLDFFTPGTFPASIGIADASPLVGAPQVRRNRQHYRNRQWVRAGKGPTATQVDDFAGDGKRRTFTCRLPLAAAPTVTVNSVNQTVGVRSVDSGMDYYWASGSKDVTQDISLPILASTDLLEVTYTGLYPIIVRVDDAAAQQYRASVEGGSGVYENVVDAPDLRTTASATAYGQGLLARWAYIQIELTFQIDGAGLVPGQMLSVDLPEHGLNGSFFISQIDWSDPGRQDGVLRQKVTCLGAER